MPSTARTLALPRAAVVFIAALATYFLLAWISLAIAVSAGTVTPMWPAAGIALAAVLVGGWPAVPAIALAAAAASLTHRLTGGPLPLADILMPLAVGSGAALQASLGARLVRRFAGKPLVLTDPPQLLQFVVWGALVACLVSASVGTVALVWTGKLPASESAAVWLTWWAGDVLGVLVFTPAALCFIGQPRDEWAPRRMSLAVPLTTVTLLLGFSVHLIVQADIAQQRKAFERDAENAGQAVHAQLLQSLQALEALRGTVQALPELDAATFERTARPWLAGNGGLKALGWSERVAHNEIAAFETRERAAGRTDFRVFTRAEAGPAQDSTGDAQIIRYLEPQSATWQAPGVDLSSIPASRQAIARATRTGTPIASAAFPLALGGNALVAYLAAFRGEPRTAAERSAWQRGMAFATLDASELLRAAGAGRLPNLQLCLIDNDASPGQQLLAGSLGCEQLAPGLPLHVSSLALAGRQWDLKVYREAPITARAASVLPFALIGLLGAAVLGALLLVMTGRARRVESAVHQRSAELEHRSVQLQAEVSERQRTTAALRDSQQRLRNILDHVPIGVAYTDTGGRIREANPRLREMLGRLDTRLSGSHIADLLHPEDRQAEADARERLLAGDVPMARWHLRFVTADGRTLWTQVGVSVLRDGQSQAKRMVWVVEDITERMALEDAQRARRGAEAANQAKSEFLSRMSHELRTPLNAMLGFSQLLELDRRQVLAPHQLEWTGQIRQAGWHLLHMINDTLDLARIESGHIELEPRALDLSDLVAGSVALLAHNAEQRGVRIDVHLNEAARAVVGDATRVKQILTNLLSNAVKYNVEGGQVVVSSRLAEDGRVALDVNDIGSGMSAEQLAQLFQPFNRLGRERGPIEGTGIGLVISLRLAELMNGSLYAQSSPGTGSTFTLELPRVPASAPTGPGEVRDDNDDEPALTEAHYHQRVVHYVEDNETNAEVMRGILALRPQVLLEVSSLGLDGLAAIRQRRPSLILLDMHLPDIDGMELLRHLQADADTAEIPVVVVSADATEARIAEAVAAGAVHYVTKPVNVPQFLAALDEILEQLDTLFG